MTTTTICKPGRHVRIPCINRVEPSRPLGWLNEGLRDFAATWPVSFAYGVIFAVLGYALVMVVGTGSALGMALTTGFFLVAPFLAIGFYDLSHRREREQLGGDRPRPFAAVGRNLASIGLFGVLLAFILSVWERISAILAGLYLGASPVPDASLGWLFSAENMGFLAMYAGTGAVFAAGVFCLAVVSLPMLMDRPVDIVTALVTSLSVVWENKATMLVWAVLIVALNALGVLTAFIGLTVIFPILGHATWHAYRDLVAQ